MLKKFSHRYTFLLIILFVYLFLRFLYLPDVIHYNSDQGRDFLVVWDMYTQHEFKLLGPPSEYAINGREFYFGPAPYYFILPAFYLGIHEPLAISYYLILINAAVFVFSIFILSKYVKSKIQLYIFAIISAVTPLFISYSQTYWNPHFMLPTSMLLLALLVRSQYIKKLSIFNFLFIGYLLGLGMQFHYSFIFVVAISIAWLYHSKKLHHKTFLSVFLGTIIGFSPIILFELLNNFNNTQTFLLVFSNSEAFGAFTLHLFYFISFFPFVIYWIAVLLAKTSRHTVAVVLGIYVLVSFVLVNQLPNQQLSYETLQKLAASIEKDNPKNFNIVDQLTRDNRAMALRYMVTAHGFRPGDFTDYTSSKTLYVYSKEPFEKLADDPIWEIQSFLPFSTLTAKKIDETLWLYKLEK